MVGYLYTSRPETFAHVRSKLARRALFFLTAGHLLILGAHVQTLVDFTHTARLLFVTDTIALALLVSPRLLTVPPRARLIGAVAAYVTSCALVFLWEPHGMTWRIIKDTVVGPDGPGSFWSYNVPILPWLAVHAAGTVLGGLLAVSISSDGRQRIEAQLVSVGCTLVAAAAAVRIICWWLIAHLLTPRGDASAIARQLSSPWNRLPPSPAHMLLFSGMALLGIAAVFAAERLHIFVRLTEWLGVVGQTSAFVFVFQFYVFYVFIPTWMPLHLALSPVIFLGAMLVIGAAARIWLHRRSRFSRAPWLGDAAPGLPGAKR
jgi:hypothetical protein